MMTVRVWRRPGAGTVKVSVNDLLGRTAGQGIDLSVDAAADLYDQLGEVLQRR